MSRYPAGVASCDGEEHRHKIAALSRFGQEGEFLVPSINPNIEACSRDLLTEVYCDEISSGCPECSLDFMAFLVQWMCPGDSCSSVQSFNGPRRVLNDLDDEVRNTGIRRTSF